MEEVTHSNKDGRVPPQDIIAEKSLLGAVMIDENALPEIVTLITGKDFYGRIIDKRKNR